ncbi:hypothetical protein [Ectobacillus panaciterrae]|uniref:hypothetical protein n=1 Tax=Ectobacillus panaciterrae TaxID=363872 RepID=UPI000410A981|nr:hypothetical protein [Ectobacillus panaciterrae]
MNSPVQAYQKGALLVHEQIEQYLTNQDPGTIGTSGGIRPEPGTNIANRQGIRKGNAARGGSV